MGAGAVKGQQEGQSDQRNSESGGGGPAVNGTQTDPSRCKPGQAYTDGSNMVCEACNANFTLFKRKKICFECKRQHCSACLVKEARRRSTQRRCSKCHMLSSGNFVRHDLQRLEVRDLRSFLGRKGVNTVLCLEKNDLIELTLGFSNSSQYLREQRASQEHTAHLEERRRLHEEEIRTAQQSGAADQDSDDEATEDSPESETDADRAARLQARQLEEMRATENRLQEELRTEEVDQRPRRKHASIDELKEEGDINDLTVRQLKEILTTNYVDFKGCVEKWELVQRVRRLWEDSKQNREKYLETGGDGVEDDEANLCKVCMDAVIDCVLLECGHMLTCTKCGRQLSECPICRQFVVRVVHTFRA